MKYITTLHDREYLVEITDESHIQVDGRCYEVDFHAIGDRSLYSLLVDGHSYEAYVYPNDEGWEVILQGRLYPVKVEDEREKWLRLAAESTLVHHAEFLLKAPMPGSIIALPVQEGQVVDKGQVLAILESMKMQNELRSPRKGTVSRVRVKIGENVQQKEILLSVI